MDDKNNEQGTMLKRSTLHRGYSSIIYIVNHED